MIGILDYGMGNLRSVQKAFEFIDGPRAILVTQPEQLAGCEKIVLPGVGNFADGMTQLRERRLVEPVTDFARGGRPLLGICLGMQLLLSDSTEDAPPGQTTAGLDLVPGHVVGFDPHPDGGPRLKVPHMGWNRLDPVRGSPLFAGLEAVGDDHAYFVHGYFCVPEDPGVVAATTDYGRSFCAAIHADNLWAMQFHPEKSQRVGLRLLHNFATL